MFTPLVLPRRGVLLSLLGLGAGAVLSACAPGGRTGPTGTTATAPVGATPAGEATGAAAGGHRFGTARGLRRRGPPLPRRSG